MNVTAKIPAADITLYAAGNGTHPVGTEITGADRAKLLATYRDTGAMLGAYLVDPTDYDADEDLSALGPEASEIDWSAIGLSGEELTAADIAVEVHAIRRMEHSQEEEPGRLADIIADVTVTLGGRSAKGEVWLSPDEANGRWTTIDYASISSEIHRLINGVRGANAVACIVEAAADKARLTDFA